MNGGVGNNGKRHSGVNNTVNVYIQRGENHETCHQWPGLFNASAVFSFALLPLCSLFCYIMSGAGRARESRNTHSPTERDWGTPSGDFFFLSLSLSLILFFPYRNSTASDTLRTMICSLDANFCNLLHTPPVLCPHNYTQPQLYIAYYISTPSRFEPIPPLHTPPYSHITLSALFRFSFSSRSFIGLQLFIW